MDLEQIGVDNVHTKSAAELIQLQAQYEVVHLQVNKYEI
jgi:hypothetical protein